MRGWRSWSANCPRSSRRRATATRSPVAVKLPVTVNGRIFPREDIDVWSFAAKKGQTITCEVHAARLGSPLDSRLEVLGPDGKTLAENDDARGTDSFLRFTAPADGTYQVRIHDSQPRRQPAARLPADASATGRTSAMSTRSAAGRGRRRASRSLAAQSAEGRGRGRRWTTTAGVRMQHVRRRGQDDQRRAARRR